MQYFSTNKKSATADFREATLLGQPSDKGLFFPEHVPSFPKDLIENASTLSKEELAFRVIAPYVGGTIPTETLYQIVSETIQFDFPLVPVTEQISSLELFHGPTLAFKDVGARFMSRCLGYFVKDLNRKVTVLVATSGDTGGAVANGFLGVEGIDVVILYPSGKVSKIQELQLTTLGKNITALEVNGSFDDCQRMVKDAFTDPDLQKKTLLTSANSINVARWLPQQFYYLFAWQQWQDKAHPPVISVPSGNFGNICAGLLACCSGMPVSHFIAACNENDTVADYLRTGVYSPKKTIHTISNAMDVGSPSNFVRILQLFKNDIQALKKIFSAYSITDDETRNTIRDVNSTTGYLLDPHGAVGYLALKKYLQQQSAPLAGYFLETAHPVKFPDSVENITQKKVELPQAVRHLLTGKKQSTSMNADAAELKEFLMNH